MEKTFNQMSHACAATTTPKVSKHITIFTLVDRIRNLPTRIGTQSHFVPNATSVVFINTAKLLGVSEAKNINNGYLRMGGSFVNFQKSSGITNLKIDDLNSGALRFRLPQRKNKALSFKRCLKTIAQSNSSQYFSSGNTQFFIEEIMAKRLADTAKHKDPWWKSLSTNHKILFDFMSLDCDHAGFWKVNFDTFDLLYKIKMSTEDMPAFGKKIIRIDEETYFLTSFIKVQYGALNPNNNAHSGVLKLLDYYNIETSPYLAPPKKLISPSQGALDKDKDMVKEMEKDKEKEIKTNDALIGIVDEHKINPDLVINLFNEICDGQGKIERYRSFHLSGNALTDFINRAGSPGYTCVGVWKELFSRVIQNQFLCGEDPKKQFVATLPWILKPDNFEVIITGGYPNTRKIKKQPDGPPEGVDWDTWLRSQPRNPEAKL